MSIHKKSLSTASRHSHAVGHLSAAPVRMWVVRIVLFGALLAATTHASLLAQDETDLETDDPDFPEDEVVEVPSGADVSGSKVDVASFDESKTVVTLTDDNLQSFLDRHEHAIVDFYAPWCDHCMKLEPEWEKAASTLKAEGLTMRFAKMDDSAGQRHIVEGYPTIKYFHKGNAGLHLPKIKQDADSIANTARRTELKHVIELKGGVSAIKGGGVDDFLAGIKKVGSFTLVAHVKRKSARAKAYLKAQEELAAWPAIAFKFAVVWLPETADSKSDASMFMWRPGFEAPDKERHEFTGAWAASNIVKWAKRGTFGVINRFFDGDLYDADALEFMGIEALVTVLLDGDDDALKASLETQLIAMTKKYPSWAAMVLKKRDSSPKILEYFGDKGKPGPMISALKFRNKHAGKYVLNGEAQIAKADSVATFVADVQAGKNMIGKSEPVPAVPEDDAGLTTLVADNFDQYVLDPTRAVIVYYFYKDCEECKILEPVWKDVAKHVKKSAKGMTVAKIDVKENDHKEAFDKVPHIVFYPAVKAESKFKMRTSYTSSRDFDGIVAFINDNLENMKEEL